MRVAVVSDIHSNLAAFEAVLDDAGRGGHIGAIWSMGDLVGYGPDPGGCIALLGAHEHVAVAGNHDRAAIGLLSTAEFNPAAAEAVLWTAGELKPEEHDFLASLPLVAQAGDFTLVHGSLRDPVWEYLVDPQAAEAHLALQGTPYGFVGHSHLQFVFTEEASGFAFGRTMSNNAEVALGEQRLIVNPGSVGQPRDGNPRAAFALLDTDRRVLTFRRVPYDIEKTQAKMREAGLPAHLVDRLARGR